MTFTDEQIDFARSCCSRWLQIRENNDKGCTTSADADHSYLLERILRGKEPLTKEAYDKVIFADSINMRSVSKISKYISGAGSNALVKWDDVRDTLREVVDEYWEGKHDRQE